MRAGEVASRIGAAEAVTHRERALSLWDRVPDAEARAGCTHVELLLALARAVCDQGDLQRWHELNRRAVEMLGPDTDPLCGEPRPRRRSAAPPSSTRTWPARRRRSGVAVEYAGDAPTAARA